MAITFYFDFIFFAFLLDVFLVGQGKGLRMGMCGKKNHFQFVFFGNDNQTSQASNVKSMCVCWCYINMERLITHPNINSRRQSQLEKNWQKCQRNEEANENFLFILFQLRKNIDQTKLQPKNMKYTRNIMECIFFMVWLAVSHSNPTLSTRKETFRWN